MRSNETSAIVVNNSGLGIQNKEIHGTTNMANLFEELFTTLFIKQILETAGS